MTSALLALAHFSPSLQRRLPHILASSGSFHGRAPASFGCVGPTMPGDEGSAGVPKEGNGNGQHLRNAKMIRIDDQIGVLPGMGEAPELLLEVGLGPVEPPALGAHRERRLEEDQHVGRGDALPHVLDVGMLLRDVTAGIACLLQTRYQC